MIAAHACLSPIRLAVQRLEPSRFRGWCHLQGILADGNPLREGRDDLLIDVCFYFIAPHRFTPMDEDFIRQLSEEVAVSPICAKADAMTDVERRAFQQHIRSELQSRE